MADVLAVLPWFLLVAVTFFAMFFHHEGRYWRDRHDELLERPLSFWQERDIRRQIRNRPDLASMFTKSPPALHDPTPRLKVVGGKRDR